MCDFITSLNQVNIVVLSERAAFPLPLTLFIHRSSVPSLVLESTPCPSLVDFLLPLAFSVSSMSPRSHLGAS